MRGDERKKEGIGETCEDCKQRVEFSQKEAKSERDNTHIR